MMIESRKIDKTQLREMKIKLPVSYHVRLHTLRVLEGRTISDTVERALERYFEVERERREHAEEILDA